MSRRIRSLKDANPNETVWETKAHRLVGSFPDWKKPLHEDCPHGLHIFMVDGTYVRNHFDSDFVQGGNGLAWPDFIPKSEIWVDVHMPKSELPYVVFHECHEAELMRCGGYYNRDHAAAKKIEDRLRHRDWPGERKRRS